MRKSGKNSVVGKSLKHYPNEDERQGLKVAAIATFVSSYARKAQRGVEPNGQRYDRDLERRSKSMKAMDMDRLLRDDES